MIPRVVMLTDAAVPSTDKYVLYEMIDLFKVIGGLGFGMVWIGMMWGHRGAKRRHQYAWGHIMMATGRPIGIPD
jgi:hypothetical protein